MIPKKITRIYKLIDKIALKGRDNILDYKVLVDDLVLSKDYDNLLMCLEIYYNYDIDKINSVDDIKNNTWDSILFNTTNNISRMLKKLYTIKDVYQVGLDIYDNSPLGTFSATPSNIKLGEIREIGSYTDESRYLLKNKEFARITKTRRDFVEVLKDDTYTLFDEDNIDKTEDQNLYNRYVDALNLLKALPTVYKI